MGKVSNRQPQDARPRSAAGTRAAIVIVAIVATLAIMLVMGAGIIGGNPVAPSRALPSSSSSASAASPSPDEVVYPGNAAINAFVVAFDQANPDQPITAPDLQPTLRDGEIDESRVTTTIAGKTVTIVGAKAPDDLSVSVSWTPVYTKKHDLDKPTHHTFVLIMRAMAPDATNDEVEARWREVASGAATASWDDHTTQFTGSTPLDAPSASTSLRLTKFDRVPIGTDGSDDDA
ncbi:MAG: hypothetical protein SOI38_00425 [Eggerthellaceae bacterium]|jgi:hypothetical protein